MTRTLTRIRSLSTALLPVLLLAAAGLGAGGCSSFDLKPWVSPYERNNLADPIMSLNRAPVSASYMHHVYDAREGSRGAQGGSGGGCGCN